MDTSLTPANTRVISSTLIPAKGKLDASPLADGIDAMFLLLKLRRIHGELKHCDVRTRLEPLNMIFAIFWLQLKVMNI
jgi:hypothetical protein